MDNEIDLKCPACGKNMTKVYVKNSGCNVDICLDGCGGIYFDNRELEKADELDENIDEISQSVKDKTFYETDRNAVRSCPVCDTPMVKLGAADGKIEIDVCNVCGGKFLDNGELNIIRENSNNPEQTHENIERLFEELYDENLNNVAHQPKIAFAGASKRRDFFVNIVSKLI